MTFWPAPAKLNLFLHILGERSDGYHELQTLFQLVDYCDELAFTPRVDNQINCTCISLFDPVTSAIIPDETNLAIKAAKLLQTKTKNLQGVDILIKKRIPIGGGLGGASSNAATTLLALNLLWQLHFSEEELSQWGLSLGADVPVFIKGKTSWAEGIGEKLTAIPLPEKYYLVVVPPLVISTAKLFSHPQLTYHTAPIRIQTFLSGHITTQNDFEKIVRQDYSVLAEALDFLHHYGKARLTGTGSCAFVTLDNQADAEKLLKKVKTRYKSFICKGVTTSPLHQMIESFPSTTLWSRSKNT
jgi:4-diphosphocytidyl-2-C-methyl-D-erythritol kinase